jgi:hypothetical protein
MSIRSRVSSVWFVLLVLISPASISAMQASLPDANAISNSQSQSAKQKSVPSPRDVLGFAPGEDRKLADWPQIVDYFKRLDSASDRVSVHQAGVSTEQRPFIVAIISSEENMQNLPRIRAAQRRLADPRSIASDQERDHLIRETPAVIAITCSIHSTEIVASQMSMELAYRLASDDSKETANILRNTVLVLVPSVNPDGVDIVAGWYTKTLGTKFEGTNPPVLYHHYAGHDNNRDWFMLTQVETQIVSSLFWKEWFPEIVYDVHQQGQNGSRMCVPPFYDPSNPNIDPVILRQVGAIGLKMAVNLTAAGYKGVVTNSTYDTWWHGGLRTAPYYHNSIGILTEAASVAIATPLNVKREQLRSSTRGLPDPLVPATNFPAVWQGGPWHMRDILNMEMITTRTVLEEAALHREEVIRNFVGAATRAIEAGKTDAPYAYIVPKAQHDWQTAARMINILIQQGVEVHQAKSDFTMDGKKYGEGSYVILLAQPYRANVKCLFEAQKYPDRRIYPGGPAEPPYDVAGWTLPMQMGVDYVEATQRFDAKIERLETAEGVLKTAERGDSSQAVRALFYLMPDANNAYTFVNDLVKSRNRIAITRVKEPVKIERQTYPAGSFVIELNPHAKGAKGATPQLTTRELQEIEDMRKQIVKYGIVYSLKYIKKNKGNAKIEASNTEPEPLTLPRLALYRSWLPSMDEGWTRWVLEQFGFQYKNIADAEVRGGNLKERFDVIILPDQSAQQIIAGNRAGSYPPEFTGGIGEAGVENLRRFVEAGGVLICLDSASELAMKQFNLPVKNVLDELRRDQFYAPGAIFRAAVDSSHPIAYGMPAEADLYFVSGARRAQAAEPDSSPGISPARAESQTGEPAAGSGASSPTSAPTPTSIAALSAAQRTPSAPRAESSTLVSAFAFEITDPERARSVARYIDGNPLRSGWLLGPQYVAGKSALVDVKVGKGRVVLFGFRPQHRAQTWGTFKLLFNSIMLGGAKLD